jgi:GT2 family glycosyltransferase
LVTLSRNVPRRVAVVVLNYNGLEDTLKCLESLKTIAEPIHVVLVDNASTIDPSEAARRVYPACDFIQTGANLGYAGGNNRGIERARQAGAEYVLILNNDTVVDPSIIRSLVDVLEADLRRGIAGPVINFLDEPSAVMTDGFAFNPGPGTEFFRRIAVPVDPAQPAVVPVDLVNGCCMMVAARVFERIGLFNEQFFIVHEESDFCLRALRAGFQNVVLGRTLVWHKGSSAFERSGRQFQRYFDARNLFHLLRVHTGRVSRSRSWRASAEHYFRYVFYRYDVECDAGKTAAADAVVEGTYDALRGWWGPLTRRTRPGLGALRGVFAAGRAVARMVRRPRRPAPLNSTN